MKLVNAYNNKYAGHFRIELDSPGGSTYDGLHNAIKNNIASGNVPAMAIGYPDSFSEYMTVKETRSNILKIDNFRNDTATLEVNKIDASGNLIPDGAGGYEKETIQLGYTAAEWNDFVTAYRDEGNKYQHDGYWSLPMYKSTEVMFYNLNYFYGRNRVNDYLFNNEDDPSKYDEGYEQRCQKIDSYSAYYGGEANHEAYKADLLDLKEYVETNLVSKGGKTYTVPTRWDEMFVTAKAMKDDLKALGIDDPLFIPVGYDSDANLMITQMKQRGIGYTTNDNIHSKEDHILFNNDKTEALLVDLKKKIDDKYLCTKGSLSVDGSIYTNTKFSDQECVISIGSTGGSDYQVNDNFAVEVAPVPYYGDTPYYIQQGPSVCFFDNNNNETVNLGAWLFYKLMSDPDWSTQLATENSYDPIRKSSIESDSYKTFISHKYDALLNYVPTITHLAQVLDNQMTSPVFIGSSTARTQMSELIGNMVHSGMSAASALETAYDATLNATK